MLGAGQDTSKSAQAVVTISLGITIISSNNSEDHPCLEPPSAFCMPPFPPAAQTECFSSISGGYGLLKPVIWMNGPWSLTQKVEKHDTVLPPPSGSSQALPVSPSFHWSELGSPGLSPPCSRVSCPLWVSRRQKVLPCTAAPPCSAGAAWAVFRPWLISLIPSKSRRDGGISLPLTYFQPNLTHLRKWHPHYVQWGTSLDSLPLPPM